MGRKWSEKVGKIKRRRGKTCRVCDWTPPGRLSKTILHAHHVVPVYLGGSDDGSNLVILCPNHHAIAHALWPEGTSTAGGRLLTPHDLVWLLKAFEEDPHAYHQAVLATVLENMNAKFSDDTTQAQPRPKEEGGTE